MDRARFTGRRVPHSLNRHGKRNLYTHFPTCLEDLACAKHFRRMPSCTYASKEVYTFLLTKKEIGICADFFNGDVLNLWMDL